MFCREDAEKFFKFLSHAKFTELRAIDPHGGVKEASFVDNLTDFLATCEKWSDKANVYVGINDRVTKGGKAENVGTLSIIPLDVDSVRAKGEASTNAELELARQKMLQIKGWLKENFDSSPFITMSGNGFHIFIKIPRVDLNDFTRPDMQQKLEVFVHQIQEKFNDDHVRIDSTFDLPRIMKCPGTISVKGDNTPERPWRMCQIVEDNDVPSAGVFNHLITIQKPLKEEANFKLGDKSAKDFAELLRRDEKLRDLFEGLWEKHDFKSRSEAEQSILTKLVMAEFSEEAINQIMSNCKVGKWNETPEAYRRTSIKNAMKYVSEQERTEIEIFFAPRFKKCMLDGTKTVTSRLMQCGRKGDIFNAFGVTFELTTEPHLESLEFILQNLLRKEGFKSESKFIEFWNETYTQKNFEPKEQVYVHEFVKSARQSTKLKELEFSCGKDLPDKVFEQTSSGDFLVFDKVTGATTKQKAVDNFEPFKRIFCKTVDNVQDYSSETQLWSEVKQYIYEHIDLQEGYDILTAWVLASWTLEKWHAVPYLFFYGPAASGKTWALEILASIGHRSIMTASATLSTVFRVVDMWHPTVFFDETEVYMRKDRGEMLNLLNSGYRKDFPAMRTEEGKEGFEVRFYDCFGFKALAGTKDFMETLKSRCIIFNMSKAVREIKTIIDNERAKNLREKLLTYRFKMLATKETQEAPNVLTGRLRELFNPLIIVAPTAEKGVIITQAKKIEEMQREEEETSLESIVFRAIFKLHEETGDEKITIADIGKIVNETLVMDEMLNVITVGAVTKRLGFKKCMKGYNKRAIRWNDELAKRLTYRYGRSEKQSVFQGKRLRRAVREFFEDAR